MDSIAERLLMDEIEALRKLCEMAGVPHVFIYNPRVINYLDDLKKSDVTEWAWKAKKEYDDKNPDDLPF